jgi:aryl-alcohol dehydrogenase-like predicted oxidoreductase
MSEARLALGSVQFGLPYGIAGRDRPVEEAEIVAILESAARQGVRCVDTAPGYGEIEAKLARLSGNADFDFVSKIPAIPSHFSPSEASDFVKQSAARSMERLGSRLKTLLFHRGADLLESFGEYAWRAMEETGRGTGINYGVSCYSPDELAGIRARFPVLVAQTPGNVFDQRLRDAVGIKGVELHIRSAFLQGLLLMPADVVRRRLPVASTAMEAWDLWCRTRDLDRLSASLGVVKSLPQVRFCVVGVDSLAQFEEITAAWDRAPQLDAGVLAVNDPEVIDPRRWKRD